MLILVSDKKQYQQLHRENKDQENINQDANNNHVQSTHK